MANKYLPKTISLTTLIPFDQPVTFIPVRTISGAVTFTKDTTGAQAGFGTILRVVADGTNVPDLTAFKSIGSGAYVNTAGVVNQLWFVFDGYDYCVSITQPVAFGGGGGGGDTTPPVILSATAINSNTVRVVFNETVVPTTVGWSVYKQDIAETSSVTAVSGAGPTWDFTVSGTAMTGSMTLKLSYNSTTGNTTDTSLNELVTFSNLPITNSISGGGGSAVALSFTSSGSDISNTGTIWNPVPVDATYNHHAISTTKRAAGTAAKCWFKWEYPGATELYFFLMTSHTEGNATDAKVAVSVEAQTIISNILADGVSDHANINSETAPLFIALDIAADGTLKLQKSTDESSWTTLWTYTVTYNGDLWVGIRLYGGGALKDPKAINFV